MAPRVHALPLANIGVRGRGRGVAQLPGRGRGHRGRAALVGRGRGRGGNGQAAVAMSNARKARRKAAVRELTLWRVAIILTCNHWAPAADGLHPLDIDWLQQNCVVETVDEPVWL